MKRFEPNSWTAGPACPLAKAISESGKTPNNQASSLSGKKYRVAHTTLILSRAGATGARGKPPFYGVGRKLPRPQKLVEASQVPRRPAYKQPISMTYGLARKSSAARH